MRHAADHGLGQLADRIGIATTCEDVVEHGRQVGPEMLVEPEARERLERPRQDPMMGAVAPYRWRILQRAGPDGRHAMPVPDRQSGHNPQGRSRVTFSTTERFVRVPALSVTPTGEQEGSKRSLE